jgi:hypothetical protein
MEITTLRCKLPSSPTYGHPFDVPYLQLRVFPQQGGYFLVECRVCFNFITVPNRRNISDHVKTHSPSIAIPTKQVLSSSSELTTLMYPPSAASHLVQYPPLLIEPSASYETGATHQYVQCIVCLRVYTASDSPNDGFSGHFSASPTSCDTIAGVANRQLLRKIIPGDRVAKFSSRLRYLATSYAEYSCRRSWSPVNKL